MSRLVRYGSLCGVRAATRGWLVPDNPDAARGDVAAFAVVVMRRHPTARPSRGRFRRMCVT